ncbi:hypothetical protein [Methanobrevibacter sp.]|uniref:hypothetical protein n=1 Tax=Methanobrevibacter sp. TaxID=66852 RepID=UPI00388D4D35
MAEEYYIEDNDLINLLKDVLGDRITDDDIEKILKATEDSAISEKDFDNVVDGILNRSKKGGKSGISDNILASENELEYLPMSSDTCPMCGTSLLNENYCPNCNLKFSFVTQEEKNDTKK